MGSGLAQFLESILSFLGSIIALIKNLNDGLVQMFVMLPKALTMLNYGVSFLPTVLLPFAVAMISICITYLIIGR